MSYVCIERKMIWSGEKFHITSMSENTNIETYPKTKSKAKFQNEMGLKSKTKSDKK